MGCKLAAAVLAAVLLAAPPASAAEPAGTVPCLLTSWSGRGAMVDESTLGDAAADALRFVSGADIGIVPGGDIPDNAIQPGQWSRQDIEDAFAEDRAVAVCEMSCRQLAELLEVCLSQIRLDEHGRLDVEGSAFAGFPQVSGMTVRFDAAAEAGARLMQVSLADGRAIDLLDGGSMVTVAAPVFLLDGGYGNTPHEHTALGLAYSDAMAAYLSAGVSVDYTKEHRLIMAGDRSDSVIAKIPAAVLPMALIVLGLWGWTQNRRRRMLGDTRWDERTDSPEDRPLL